MKILKKNMMIRLIIQIHGFIIHKKILRMLKPIVLLLTYFVPALLSSFAKNCSLGLPQKLLS